MDKYLFWVLVWFGIGFIVAIVLVALDWYNGEHLRMSDLSGCFLAVLLWPWAVAVALDHFSHIVLIRGRKNDKKS